MILVVFAAGVGFGLTMMLHLSMGPAILLGAALGTVAAWMAAEW